MVATSWLLLKSDDRKCVYRMLAEPRVVQTQPFSARYFASAALVVVLAVVVAVVVVVAEDSLFRLQLVCKGLPRGLRTALANVHLALPLRYD